MMIKKKKKKRFEKIRSAKRSSPEPLEWEH